MFHESPEVGVWGPLMDEIERERRWDEGPAGLVATAPVVTLRRSAPVVSCFSGEAATTTVCARVE